MGKIWKIISCILLVCLLAGIAIYGYDSWHAKNYLYETEYVEKLGFDKGYNYSDNVEATLGKLVDVEKETLSSGGGKFYYMEMKFDGYELRFEADEELCDKPKRYGDYELICARITSPDYRIGKYEIGVGADKELVKKAYRGKKPLIDKAEDEIGFIDGTKWVTFKFDQSDRVEKITFTIGGP